MSDSIEKQIMDLREVSEAINNYILQENFIDPTEEHDIDPTEILIQCRLILLDELKQFGIIPSNKEELVLDGYKLSNAINIREVFDSDFLKMFITGLKDDDSEDFKEILQNKFTVDKEFGFELVVGFILDRYPSNKKFAMMKYYASDYHVEDIFYDRIFEIYETTVRFISETKEDNTLLIEYLNHKYKHINNVKKAAEYFMGLKYNEKLNLVELRARLSLHDKDLIRSDKVRETALLWKLKQKPTISDDMKALMEVAELTHHYSNRHHLEFFEKGEPISLVDKIEIASDLYNQQGTKEEYLADVKKEFDEIDLPQNVKEGLLQFAGLLNLWEN